MAYDRWGGCGGGSRRRGRPRRDAGPRAGADTHVEAGNIRGAPRRDRGSVAGQGGGDVRRCSRGDIGATSG
eukprot:5082911-Pyramimonas_sp.AAC.1